MATLDYWNDVGTEKELWAKLVGKGEEDKAETQRQAERIFSGVTGRFCLEIGCGTGRLMKYATYNFNHVYGVDWSEKIIELGPKTEKHMTRILTDGWSLPFPEGMFDFVYSFTCFQHMEQLEMIQSNLREIYRVMKSGSEVLIQTVRGSNEPGRHDGYVFASPESFFREFMLARFSKAYRCVVEDEWMWMRATK